MAKNPAMAAKIAHIVQQTRPRPLAKSTTAEIRRADKQRPRPMTAGPARREKEKEKDQPRKVGEGGVKLYQIRPIRFLFAK